MELNELESQIGLMTGRPDVPILPYLLMVCNEIRLSGYYEEDLVVGEREYDLNYNELTGEFQTQFSDNEVPMTFLFVQAELVDGSLVDLEVIDVTDWKRVRKCPPLNSYYMAGKSMHGRLIGQPVKLLYTAYSRVAFFMEGNKVYEEPWPIDAIPHLVTMGTASHVMLAAGDDASRDRFYTEYQRLLRQFQLSRVPINQ